MARIRKSKHFSVCPDLKWNVQVKQSQLAGLLNLDLHVLVVQIMEDIQNKGNIRNTKRMNMGVLPRTNSKGVALWLQIYLQFVFWRRWYQWNKFSLVLTGTQIYICTEKLVSPVKHIVCGNHNILIKVQVDEDKDFRHVDRTSVSIHWDNEIP